MLLTFITTAALKMLSRGWRHPCLSQANKLQKLKRSHSWSARTLSLTPNMLQQQRSMVMQGDTCFFSGDAQSLSNRLCRVSLKIIY